MSELTEAVDVYEVLEKLEIQRIHSASGGAEVNFSCPFAGHAHGDEDPSAYMNVETTAWFCWGCKERGGTVVSFVAKVIGVSYTQADRWLREAYGVSFREPAGGSMVAETEARFGPVPELAKLRRPDPSWQEIFSANITYDSGARALDYATKTRGLTIESVIEWGLGYDQLSDRLTIPVRDIDGSLVGFKGRALDDEHEPKYLILGDRHRATYGFDPYEASEVVFGLHRAHEQKQGVLCEGELNGIALGQIGVPRPLALGMSYLTDRHSALIVQEVDVLVSFLDSDKAGQEGLWGHASSSGGRLPGLVEKLEPHLIVKKVPDHKDDPAKLVRDGRGNTAIELITAAEPSVALTTASR